MPSSRPIFRPIASLGAAAIGTVEFIGGVGYLIWDAFPPSAGA